MDISPSNGGGFVGPVLSEVFPTTFGHLSFAVWPVYSMTGNKAESQLLHVLHNQGGQVLHGLEEVILELKEGQVGTTSD